MGVWIETLTDKTKHQQKSVTPCVGVWIETEEKNQEQKNQKVTPCVGVWIETILTDDDKIILQSHPAWVCGLKHELERSRRGFTSHTLRGCVD